MYLHCVFGNSMVRSMSRRKYSDVIISRVQTILYQLLYKNVASLATSGANEKGTGEFDRDG